MDRSRRPHHSPRRSAAEIEQLVVELRTTHPAWGGRKLRARMIALGHPVVPQPSTITAILARHHLIEPSEAAKRQSFCRFEHPHPNDLWQMDFKGDFALDAGRCFPLTVLDDHSRFALGLLACPGQSIMPTQTALREVFRRYGLPSRMTMDNGSRGVPPINRLTRTLLSGSYDSELPSLTRDRTIRRRKAKMSASIAL